MTEKRAYFFIFFLVVSLFLMSSAKAITGEVITGEATQHDVGASVTLVGSLVINVLSPENKTYIFGAGETEFPIDLNVTSDSAVESWRFTLEDLDTHIIINNSVPFTPNSTFYAALGGNNLTVYANASDGAQTSASVIFTVRDSNNAPELGAIPDELLVCENRALFYEINATDADADDLIVDLFPKDPFFIFPTSFSGSSFVESQIFSVTLGKAEVGLYEEVISVTDGEATDLAYSNITVIEVNNLPTLSAVGAQTVWAQGEGSSFYKQAHVTDIEDGAQNSGNFIFDLTYANGSVPFFGVSPYGVMSFTANSSLIPEGNLSEVYNLTLCATDSGIDNPHENISICTGQSSDPYTVCRNFSLTVTAENRAPTITSFYPLSSELNVNGSSFLDFNITKSDPDGTIPDSYWYVDGVLNQSFYGSSYDLFNYTFGCGVSGVYPVFVLISDGELNDTMQWDVNVSETACPVLSPGNEGGGSSGGGGGAFCTPLWACEDWNTCRNNEDALASGFISGDDYRSIQLECQTNGWNSDICGVQSRVCTDFSSCNYNPPETLQACYFTENPSCSDGIKNCHDGACEFLVDCGGPCGACGTCSDGIQNQGEEGIDCGGSCPLACSLQEPSPTHITGRTLVSILTGLVLLVLLAILFIKIYQIFSLRSKKAQQVM